MKSIARGATRAPKLARGPWAIAVPEAPADIAARADGDDPAATALRFVLDQPFGPEAHMPIRADDDMVVQHHAQMPPGFGEVAGQADVLWLGEGSPDGWLCTTMSAVACRSSARRMISRI